MTGRTALIRAGLQKRCTVTSTAIISSPTPLHSTPHNGVCCYQLADAMRSTPGHPFPGKIAEDGPLAHVNTLPVEFADCSGLSGIGSLGFDSRSELDENQAPISTVCSVWVTQLFG